MSHRDPKHTTPVNPNGTTILLATILITFFINAKSVSNIFDGNAADCIVLDNWVFDSLILSDKLFAKAFGKFETSLLVNNNLCRILTWLLEFYIIFDDSLKTD